MWKRPSYRDEISSFSSQCCAVETQIFFGCFLSALSCLCKWACLCVYTASEQSVFDWIAIVIRFLQKALFFSFCCHLVYSVSLSLSLTLSQTPAQCFFLFIFVRVFIIYICFYMAGFFLSEDVCWIFTMFTVQWVHSMPIFLLVWSICWFAISFDI